MRELNLYLSFICSYDFKTNKLNVVKGYIILG